MHRKSSVFNSFWNNWSEAAERAELASSFHHRGTTEVKRFAWDLFLCGGGTIRQ